jgi:hypothetical protein
VSTGPSKSSTHGGSAAHLKLEKPRFLFLEGSGGAAVVPAGAAVALADASAVLADSSTDDPVAGATAPATDARSTAASAAHGDRGGGLHLSGGRPASLSSSSSSSSSSDEEFAGVVGGGGAGGESAGTPRSAAPGALAARFFSPSRALPAPAPATARRKRSPGPEASADLIARRPPSPSADDNC